MKKSHKSLLKNIFSALAVIVFGFILLNLTFLFDFVYQTVVRGAIEYLTPLEPSMHVPWFPPLMHFSFLVVIGIISWFVFKSRLWTLLKAIYLCVPIAAVLVTLGMFLYKMPFILYPLSILLCSCTLYYFYRTRQPWIYYFTVIFWAIVLAIFTLFGGEI